jgi:F-type H+-transporting ATPase subunit b
MPAFLDPAEAEFWVGVGLVIFLLIAFWKGRGAILGALDAKGLKVRADLDEAARLRTEAERLLASIRAQRQDSERQAAEMLASAQADARRLEVEAHAKLEQRIALRERLAERKIAQAEAQAVADVKGAAADLAARAAEQVLMTRLATDGTDPMLDRSIAQIAGRLN